MTKLDNNSLKKIEESKRLAHWYELLNIVCLDKGHQNNTELAYQLCKRQNKTSQKNTEAATRNLSNWRTGANLPSRMNFRLLTEILNISENRELQDHWYQLYKTASHSSNYEKIRPPSRSGKNQNYYQRLTNMNLIIVSILLLFSITISIGVFWFFIPPSLRITNQERMKLNNIPWAKHISLHIGEEVVVHGKRGNCGELPEAPKKIQETLPNHLITGVLKTGELGMRTSRRCNGPTPAREIVFKGINPGRETFFLYGDDITVIVTE